MEKQGRGWNNSSQAKPAKDYDIRLGRGLLREESSRFPRYLAVAGSRAYAAAEDSLSEKPVGVIYPQWCDFDHLAGLSEGLPDDAGLVVGIGGGVALDAAKYVALTKDLPLVLIPSIVSSGAIIHGTFARWKGRHLVGKSDEWPWVDPEYVLVDYDLVLSAPYYLNSAGIGDILCSYSGVAEWGRKRRRGELVNKDDKVLQPLIENLEYIADNFPKTYDASGNLTDESVSFIAQYLKDRDGKIVRDPEFTNGDHPFLHVIELANDRSWVHGEIVALGAIIIAWLCDENPEKLIDWLAKCKVRYRPAETGVGYEHLYKGLKAAGEYFSEKDVDSILRYESFTDTKIEKLWGFLQGL